MTPLSVSSDVAPEPEPGQPADALIGGGLSYRSTDNLRVPSSRIWFFFVVPKGEGGAGKKRNKSNVVSSVSSNPFSQSGTMHEQHHK